MFSSFCLKYLFEKNIFCIFFTITYIFKTFYFFKINLLIVFATGLPQDRFNGFADRFLGFSVHISNTTDKEDGELCFVDTNYTMDTLPNPINITTQISGRYVIYYNNRTHPPFPSDYHPFAFSDLCEIQVYGKLLLII